MIQRLEDIAVVASATVARWQAEALAIVQHKQAAHQMGLDFACDLKPSERHTYNLARDWQIERALAAGGRFALHGKQQQQGR